MLEGVKTNIDYQYEIINDEDFIEGNIDTGFIERFQKNISLKMKLNKES